VILRSIIVDNHDAGSKFFDLLEGLFRVYGPANDFEACVLAKQFFEPTIK
jgi:hypothetical protein